MTVLCVFFITASVGQNVRVRDGEGVKMAKRKLAMSMQGAQVGMHDQHPQKTRGQAFGMSRAGSKRQRASDARKEKLRQDTGQADAAKRHGPGTSPHKRSKHGTPISLPASTSSASCAGRSKPAGRQKMQARLLSAPAPCSSATRGKGSGNACKGAAGGNRSRDAGQGSDASHVKDKHEARGRPPPRTVAASSSTAAPARDSTCSKRQKSETPSPPRRRLRQRPTNGAQHGHGDSQSELARCDDERRGGVGSGSRTKALDDVPASPVDTHRGTPAPDTASKCTGGDQATLDSDDRERDVEGDDNDGADEALDSNDGQDEGPGTDDSDGNVDVPGDGADGDEEDDDSDDEEHDHDDDSDAAGSGNQDVDVDTGCLNPGTAVIRLPITTTADILYTPLTKTQLSMDFGASLTGECNWVCRSVMRYEPEPAAPTGAAGSRRISHNTILSPARMQAGRGGCFPSSSSHKVPAEVEARVAHTAARFGRKYTCATIKGVLPLCQIVHSPVTNCCRTSWCC